MHTIFVVFVILVVSHTCLPFSRVGSALRSAPTRSRLNKRSFLVCAAVSPDVDKAGKTLYEIAGKGDLEKLKAAILEAKGNKNILNYRVKERYGRTPLVIASYYGKLEAVKILVATRGVDINMGSDFGATALHFAAHRGHTDVVNFLLSVRGIKVNTLATDGKWTGATALDVCEGMGMSGKPEIIEAIKKKGGKMGKGK